MIQVWRWKGQILWADTGAHTSRAGVSKHFSMRSMSYMLDIFTGRRNITLMQSETPPPCTHAGAEWNLAPHQGGLTGQFPLPGQQEGYWTWACRPEPVAFTGLDKKARWSGCGPPAVVWRPLIKRDELKGGVVTFVEQSNVCLCVREDGTRQFGWMYLIPWLHTPH